MTSSATRSLLMLNAGSSSVKFKLFSNSDDLRVLVSGKVYNLGNSPFFMASGEKLNGENELFSQQLPSDSTQDSALQFILNWLDNCGEQWQLEAVTHRIVHGGTLFARSIQIDSTVTRQLQTLVPLAPLHQPYNLNAIEIVKKVFPNIPQFACFDTAFHANRAPLFTEYALPKTLREKGIRRYGFHGLSYEWIVRFLQQSEPDLAQSRVIAAHLGNGSSLCAIKNGLSIDTTMGMTALAGLPMGTRCGELDPGVVIYLLRDLELSFEETETILYENSGLLGLSGWTNDVKTLQASQDKRAQFALNFYCLKAAQYMAMMAVSMGGVDGIVFTGGIGENSTVVRERILGYLEFMKPFAVRVIQADEEQMMAIHTLSLLEKK
ncbi:MULTISPECIES: acetate/propionate family kinase [unclassified Legionella]|uniref:acetate/propionate family kinase n=1 Tax=unclassified Legionella TaxID=2622702 RepID=UPI00105498B1|nr:MULTISPECIES: acetate/propionate family kinase [unclassified Legionella]MDI9818301.1 acetate/propionate family kinase [Legionella sp. PL877]